jgi:hypothetical protein
VSHLATADEQLSNGDAISSRPSGPSSYTHENEEAKRCFESRPSCSKSGVGIEFKAEFPGWGSSRNTTASCRRFIQVCDLG